MGGIIPQMIEKVKRGRNSHLIRAHRAHTLRAMEISPMAMPLLRGLYSSKFYLLLLMNFLIPL